MFGYGFEGKDMNFIPMGFWGWWLGCEPRVETRGYKNFIPTGLLGWLFNLYYYL